LRRETTHIESGGLCWLAVKEFCEKLASLNWQKVRVPNRLSQVEMVKDNMVRTVARLPDPDRPDGPGYFVKRFKLKKTKEKLKHLLIPTKARHEWRICRALQSDGIPTCDVLAIAEQKRGPFFTEAFLVSREVQDATTLKQFILEWDSKDQEWDETYKAQVVEELARLTGSLARLGYYHRDYHAGNILIRPQSPAGERLWVVDLHRISQRALRRRQVLRMLAMLADSSKLPAVNTGHRLRFLSIFLREWQGRKRPGKQRLRKWGRAIEHRRARLHRRHMRSRTRRCLTESTMFTREDYGGYRIHRRRDFPAAAAWDVAGLHMETLAGEEVGCRLCKRGERTAVTLCPCDAIPPLGVSYPAEMEELKSGMVCAKSFSDRSMLARLKNLLRPCSRARQDWIGLMGFVVRGLPAARPLALMERRGWLCGGPDLLIMEALEGTSTLDEFVRGMPPQHTRRRLGEAIANMLVKLIEARAFHPDVKPTNVLVRESDGELELWLVDMARARFDSRAGRNRWVRYLSQLNAGIPRQVGLLDRMRCLRRCSEGRWNQRERLEIARAVYRKSLRRKPVWLSRMP